jgi:lysine-N-methylase
LQNWDCHACTNCCREYWVHVTEEERRRIAAQGWEKEPSFQGVPLFRRAGAWWNRDYLLNRLEDGRCFFLSDQGRCRIHERFGPTAKPLVCRLFPFVLIPAGNHWRVSLRYACPSAAANMGRPLKEHARELADLAQELAGRPGQQDGQLPAPPPLQPGQPVDWPDLLRFNDTLLELVRDRRDRIDRRLRKCVALARVCRQARFDKITGGRLAEFLEVLRSGIDSEVPADPASVEPPSWVGRVLFRQVLAIHARQDYGPDPGEAARSSLARIRATWRFVRGSGPVPRLHARLPGVPFERLELPAGPLPCASEELLERYYTVKVESLQFCGVKNFRMAFWDGLEALVQTLPVLLWLSRAFADLPREEAVMQAVSIVDNHFGLNPLLGTRRQRLSLRLLAQRGELDRLVAWYSR